MRPRVALALFVKNEYSDIAGWIAWHAAWGVSTFFIYEDHSSDGTYEILQAAAKCYDIRLTRTNPIEQPDFYLRQRDAFMDAAQQARGQFDWIGFLDGDEYIYLRYHETLQTYLADLDHADGIAFSWRIHGTSGRVVRPHALTVAAFPRHSTPELNDNVLVKSFVRPEKMGNKYHNPHWFDVSTQRYVRPNGVPVLSANSAQEIDWNDGFVLHYICRSLEHYIQRIKRRLNVDLSDSDGYLKHFDRNDVLDEEPLKLVPRTEVLLLPIYEAALDYAIEKLRSAATFFVDVSFHEPATSTEYNASPPERVLIYRFETFFKTRIYYIPSESRLLHTTPDVAERHGFLEVLGSKHSSTPHLMTLFIPGFIGPLKISMDERLMRSLVYRCHKRPDGRLGLRNPISNLYLSCQDPSSGSNLVEANRRSADEWEFLEPTLIEEQLSSTANTISGFFADRGFSVSRIIHWLKSMPQAPDRETFLRVFYQASPSVQEEISRGVPGLLWNVM
ncbi:glycosyltransferase family 2 protein [Gluconobacter sp. P1D12_c]|uniref:glycosyltransferase family 2 protein n=1 Tax=Gluconobacter sp. P1D12_c TaxID=2762614 RepID=UPI001C058B2D|nr:glycosyltransferase family 2 protein [Gluconobacter sp. P1D12_c]